MKTTNKKSIYRLRSKRQALNKCSSPIMNQISAKIDPQVLLKQNGLKVTSFREALLYALLNADRPLSAQELMSQLNKKNDFDQATLFRSLKAFIEKKVISMVDLGEGFHRYELICSVHGHHHHIVCTKCKKIEVIPICIPPEVFETLEKSGFTDIAHRMDFTGICKECGLKK